MNRRACAGMVAVAFAGCAGRSAARMPVANLAAEQGPPAAEYALMLLGARAGTVSVRAGGRFCGVADGRPGCFLEVSLRVVNEGAGDVIVPLDRLHVMGPAATPLVPESVNQRTVLGELAVPAASGRTIDALYRLPGGSASLRTFTLQWVILVDGAPERHGTSFVAAPEPSYAWRRRDIVGPYGADVTGRVEPFSPFCGPLYCYGYY